jgi:DNA-binding NarL/FixJ family response regulator
VPFQTIIDVGALVGRDAHCRALAALLGEARVGRGGALVVTGEPGVGKTALLQDVMAIAGDATVLAITGLESEASLPFAGLGDLLRPLLGSVSQLPVPQARALRAALALDEGDGGLSRYAVCLATLGLLTMAAEREIVLAVIDDAQWIDAPSLTALLFAARRLSADPVAIVFAVRDPAPDEMVAARLAELRVGGLGRRESSRLLDRLRPGRVTPHVADELWRATGGNPLALIDAAGALDDRQLAGVAPVSDPLPVRARLRQAFAARLDALPPPAREALLVVALSASADEAGMDAALDRLGGLRTWLPVAEDAGLIRRDGDRWVFPHPLLRAAVRWAATAGARRRVYDALAATSSGGRRAWYLAAERDGPDEHAAAELAAAADEMRRRTGYADAARALHRAAELSADPARRAGLLFAAASDAQLCGMLADAAGWLAEARLHTCDPDKAAEVALAQASVLTRRGTPSIAQQVLVDAAAAARTADPARAGSLLSAAVYPAMTEGRFREAAGYAREAVALAGGHETSSRQARIVLAETLLFTGQVRESRQMLSDNRDYLAGLDPLADAETLSMVAFCWNWLEDTAAASTILTQVIGATRRAGALNMLVRALVFDAEVRRCTGEWGLGYAEAEESLQLARELREVSNLGFALAVLARFDAAQGRRQSAEKRLAEARHIGGPLGTPGLSIFEGTARGLMHLTAGEHEHAIACLEEVSAFAVRTGLGNSDFLPWAADLVEAYVRAGRPADAVACLADLERRAAATGLIRSQAAVACCRGITATDPDTAERHFRAALALYLPGSFESARTGLLLAGFLRRNRRRVAARDLLHDSLAVFRRLGAQPYADRAVAELAVSGEREPRRPASALHVLTSQELLVARAVADGMSNPEVAAALFISRKTVESHLSSAYRKLGLRSRTQLVRYLDDAGDHHRGDGSGRPGDTAGSA